MAPFPNSSEGPAETHVEEWRTAMNGRKMSKVAGKKIGNANAYEVLRNEEDEEEGEETHVEKENGKVGDFKEKEIVEVKDYHVDNVSIESLDSKISEAISQDSIYVPMDGRVHRVVETNFYTQGNTKAVSKWTQLKEKVQNCEEDIENKDLAINHAELINCVNINQAKHLLENNRETFEWYEDVVQELNEEKAIAISEKEILMEGVEVLQKDNRKLQQQVEIYKQLCKLREVIK